MWTDRDLNKRRDQLPEYRGVEHSRRGCSLYSSSGTGQTWPFQVQQEGHWGYRTVNKMDGDRKQSQDRIKNIWVSQAVVRNLYFILRVTEMRWRILRWGISGWTQHNHRALWEWGSRLSVSKMIHGWKQRSERREDATLLTGLGGRWKHHKPRNVGGL